MVQETKMILEALRKLTGSDDTYKVIEAEEILAILPCQMTKLQLSSAIRDLRDREYIKVKYFNPDEYCLLTVKAPDDILEHIDDTAHTSAATAPRTAGKVVEKTTKSQTKKAFLMGFLGSLLGGGVVMTIAIILLEVVFK